MKHRIFIKMIEKLIFTLNINEKHWKFSFPAIFCVQSNRFWFCPTVIGMSHQLCSLNWTIPSIENFITLIFMNEDHSLLLIIKQVHNQYYSFKICRFLTLARISAIIFACPPGRPSVNGDRWPCILKYPIMPSSFLFKDPRPWLCQTCIKKKRIVFYR